MSPSLYAAGKWLAAESRAKELPILLEWLGGSCEQAEFSRFFSRALALAAVVLLPMMFWRIRRLRAGRESALESSQKKVGWKMAVIQILIGTVMAGTTLWGVGLLLQLYGAYMPAVDPPALGKLLKKVLIPAVAVPLVEEWLFRGVLLGLWLKCARPLSACVGSSLLFALIHFVKLPDGAVIGDPAACWAGFELLGKIIFHFSDPRFLVTDFATLFVVGMILAWARLRTGVLWFSMGLHAGWIIAFKGFNLLHTRIELHGVSSWWVGDTLRSGLAPLITLVLTIGLCHALFHQFKWAGSCPILASR